MDLVDALRQRLPSLEAAEGFFAAGLGLVLEHGGLPEPLERRHPAYLLVQTAGPPVGSPPGGSAEEELASVLDGLEQVADAVVVTEPRSRRALWRYREAHTEAISAVGVPVKLDVALPRGALPAFVDGLDVLVADAAPGARSVVFGHLAEGNLHINVLGAGDLAEVVTDRVLAAVAAAGGSISAEHGIGRAKVGWLALSRSPAELAAMAAVKSALDPAWMLGPGVLLPGRGVNDPQLAGAAQRLPSDHPA